MKIEIDTELETITIKDAVSLDELNDWLEGHFIDGYAIVPLGYDPNPNPNPYPYNGRLTVGTPISPWYTTSTASVFKCATADEGTYKSKILDFLHEIYGNVFEFIVDDSNKQEPKFTIIYKPLDVKIFDKRYLCLESTIEEVMCRFDKDLLKTLMFGGECLKISDTRVIDIREHLLIHNLKLNWT